MLAWESVAPADKAITKGTLNYSDYKVQKFITLSRILLERKQLEEDSKKEAIMASLFKDNQQLYL